MEVALDGVFGECGAEDGGYVGGVVGCGGVECERHGWVEWGGEVVLGDSGRGDGLGVCYVNWGMELMMASVGSEKMFWHGYAERSHQSVPSKQRRVYSRVRA